MYESKIAGNEEEYDIAGFTTDLPTDCLLEYELSTEPESIVAPMTGIRVDGSKIMIDVTKDLKHEIYIIPLFKEFTSPAQNKVNRIHQ